VAQGGGWDWAAGGRALVRALVPFGNDIYPDSEEPGYDPSKKPIIAVMPDCRHLARQNLKHTGMKML